MVRVRKKPRSSSWKISSCACEPGRAGEVEAVAELDALARLDRAHRAGEAAVEALLPAHVRAEAGHEAEGDDLEGAADRLVRLALRR